MFLRSLRLCGLLALLLLASGCESGVRVPPGGSDAVRYWHAVLQQYPDLPAKVQAIVENRGEADYGTSVSSEVEVRIHGESEVVAVSGRRVDVIVTDLDTATLHKLLKLWKAVPDMAKQLNAEGVLPITLPESTRHIVVLGSEGRIAVSAPGGQDWQTVDIRIDEVAAHTSISVHAFAPEGQLAIQQLDRGYNLVRGPPRSAVVAGQISLPPPEENVTVLVVGQLGSLDIAGPTDHGQQDISFARYLNHHDAVDQVSGVYAGEPFANDPAYLASRTDVDNETPAEWLGETSNDSSNEVASNPTSNNGLSSIDPVQALPQAPTQIPGSGLQWQPPVNHFQNFEQHRFTHVPIGGIPGGGGYVRPPTNFGRFGS